MMKKRTKKRWLVACIAAATMATSIGSLGSSAAYWDGPQQVSWEIGNFTYAFDVSCGYANGSNANLTKYQVYAEQVGYVRWGSLTRATAVGSFDRTDSANNFNFTLVDTDGSDKFENQKSGDIWGGYATRKGTLTFTVKANGYTRTATIQYY